MADPRTRELTEDEKALCQRMGITEHDFRVSLCQAEGVEPPDGPAAEPGQPAERRQRIGASELHSGGGLTSRNQTKPRATKLGENRERRGSGETWGNGASSHVTRDPSADRDLNRSAVAAGETGNVLASQKLTSEELAQCRAVGITPAEYLASKTRVQG